MSYESQEADAPIACDPCGGTCTDACDAGAGTWPERQEAERTGVSVSDQRVPYAEQVPTVAATALAMRPYLRLLSNQGWPGLTTREADDMCNLRADLEAASERLVR